jgi:hypothetical protein
MVRLSNKLPVTVNVVLPLGDHQINSVEVVEIHEAVLPLWAIFIRYSEQQINTVLSQHFMKLRTLDLFSLCVIIFLLFL